MKQKLMILSIAGLLALGSAAALNAGERGEGKRWHGHGGPGGKFGLKHVTEELDLTPQQQAQVAPIIEQAKPQLRAIRQEAMQKTQALIQTSAAQIRPLLNAEQQQKLDKLQAAHVKMREAMREMHEAKE